MDIPIQIVNGTKEVIIQVSDPFNEVVRQLLITIIGAFLGFLSALLAYKLIKRKEDKDVKQKTIDSLSEELKQDQNKIKYNPNIWEEVSAEHWKGSDTVMSTTAFESVVNSGHFSLLPPTLQSKTSDLYIQINSCNSATIEILNFSYSDARMLKGSFLPIRPLIFRRDEIISSILNEIPKLLIELQSER